MGISARGLHPSFQITRDQYWYWNHEYGEKDFGSTLKLALYFNDPRCIRATHLHAKVGSNRDRKFPYRYTMRVYGKDTDRGELERYARGFPFAELIIGLDHNGGTLPNAACIRLK